MEVRCHHGVPVDTCPVTHTPMRFCPVHEVGWDASQEDGCWEDGCDAGAVVGDVRYVTSSLVR